MGIVAEGKLAGRMNSKGLVHGRGALCNAYHFIFAGKIKILPQNHCFLPSFMPFYTQYPDFCGIPETSFEPDKRFTMLLNVAIGSMVLVAVSSPAFYYLFQQVRKRREEEEQAAERVYVRAHRHRG